MLTEQKGEKAEELWWWIFLVPHWRRKGLPEESWIFRHFTHHVEKSHCSVILNKRWSSIRSVGELFSCFARVFLADSKKVPREIIWSNKEKVALDSLSVSGQVPHPSSIKESSCSLHRNLTIISQRCLLWLSDSREKQT